MSLRRIPKTIIAVSGLAQAGKDTWADNLTALIQSDVNSCRYKMAESLREAVGSAFASLRIERSAWTEIQRRRTCCVPSWLSLASMREHTTRMSSSMCVLT